MAKKKQFKLGRLQRYLRRVRKALEGRHSKEIVLNARLTGCASDTWSTLREAAEGLPFDDRDVLVLLMQRGARRVRAELREMERE